MSKNKKKKEEPSVSFFNYKMDWLKGAIAHGFKPPMKPIKREEDQPESEADDE